MKILFITELTHVGGVDTFLSGLIGHWPSADDEIIVLANAGHPGLSKLANRIAGRAFVGAHGVPVYVDRILRNVAKGVKKLKIFAPIVRSLYAIPTYLGFRRLFQRIDPDRVVIVAGGYPGGDSCRIAALAWSHLAGDRPKALFNVHNLAVPVSCWNIFERFADRVVARSVSAFVAVSNACADSLKNRPALWESGKVSYILNGIAPPLVSLEHTSIREEFGLPIDCPVVLMLATYEHHKGHDFLLAAFALISKRIPDARLVVCGFGYPEEVRRVKESCRLRGLEGAVIFAGFRNDAHRFLASADVLAVPTQAYESFGLVAVEAMSLGIPVVATRVGGLPEVIEENHGGYLVDPDDVDGFSAHLYALLDDVDLRRRQGQQGKERYMKLFTAHRMARDYAERIVGGVPKSYN